jgi:hypothetical protein
LKSFLSIISNDYSEEIFWSEIIIYGMSEVDYDIIIKYVKNILLERELLYCKIYDETP